MNKRQAKKKNKNQFDAYCRNYKERRLMRKHFDRTKQNIYKFEVSPKEVIDLKIEW